MRYRGQCATHFPHTHHDLASVAVVCVGRHIERRHARERAERGLKLRDAPVLLCSLLFWLRNEYSSERNFHLFGAIDVTIARKLDAVLVTAKMVVEPVGCAHNALSGMVSGPAVVTHPMLPYRTLSH